jgi:hypothetical protein
MLSIQVINGEKYNAHCIELLANKEQLYLLYHTIH